MKFVFIEQHARAWPVNVMCRMLGVSRSGYCDWRDRAPSARTTVDLALLHDVRRLQTRHQGRYGSPRMHAALRAEGHRCSRGRVERLMRRHGIRALAGRRFRPCTTDSCHYLPIAPNLLAQRFTAPGPNRSRTGNCYDNAPMESFFHTLKVELVHQCRWATQAEARQALFGYIEGYYNRHRMHSALGYLTPEQAEQRMTG